MIGCLTMTMQWKFSKTKIFLHISYFISRLSVIIMRHSLIYSVTGCSYLSPLPVTQTASLPNLMEDSIYTIVLDYIFATESDNQ